MWTPDLLTSNISIRIIKTKAERSTIIVWIDSYSHLLLARVVLLHSMFYTSNMFFILEQGCQFYLGKILHECHSIIKNLCKHLKEICLVYILYITIISLTIKTNRIKVHQPSDSSFSGAIVHTVNILKYLQSLNYGIKKSQNLIHKKFKCQGSFLLIWNCTFLILSGYSKLDAAVYLEVLDLFLWNIQTVS